MDSVGNSSPHLDDSLMTSFDTSVDINKDVVLQPLE